VCSYSAGVSVWAVVVAAGSGRRYGGPKHDELVGGRRVVDWSVAAARRACDGVVVVVAADAVATAVDGADRLIGGGATRADSVRAGLGAVPEDADIVVVHDAARPAATDALFDAVIDAVRAGFDGAVPGVPVTDTIKVVADDHVVRETLDRRVLVAVQTPQAFRAAALRDAHRTSGMATDDAALVEAAGGRVVVVAGDVANVKLTVPGDLAALDSTLAAIHG
jgi:2-C-methyl-D-erythritol 4-phosphate cytidylyltransferase